MMKVASMALMLSTWKTPPMFLLVVIIVIAGLMSGVIMMVSGEYWSAILLVMVYISGVMVLFMYIASITPHTNKMMKSLNWKQMILLIVMFSEIENPQKNMMMTMKYTNSFNINNSTLIMATTMVLVMASILPMVAINLSSGLKSSK